MSNIFLEALQIRRRSIAGEALTAEEQTTYNAALIPLDRIYGDLPIEEALKQLSDMLESTPGAVECKSWLVADVSGSGHPLNPAIRLDGRIAELVKWPRRPHRCKECGGGIEICESHYTVIWGGAGLGNIKFPARVHVACLPQHFNMPETASFLKKLWEVMFDYAHANCADLEKAGRLAGYIAGMQRVWTKAREADKLLIFVRNIPAEVT